MQEQQHTNGTTRTPQSFGRDYTPTERRILALLSDGMPHRTKDFHAVLTDDLGPVTNIYTHITNLRKKLLPKGQTIICELIKRGTYYRHVRLLSPRNEER